MCGRTHDRFVITRDKQNLIYCFPAFVLVMEINCDFQALRPVEMRTLCLHAVPIYLGRFVTRIRRQQLFQSRVVVHGVRRYEASARIGRAHPSSALRSRRLSHRKPSQLLLSSRTYVISALNSPPAIHNKTNWICYTEGTKLVG